MPDNMNVKRTKVVVTLGPATNSEEMIRALAERGVDVSRINFSHGTEEERLAVIAAVKKVRGELDLPLAILQDLQGPKIRLGVFSRGPCEIMTGGVFRLTTQVVDGNAEQASVDYPPVTTDVRPGELIFINDGLIRLKVREIRGDTIVTDVLKGGIFRTTRGSTSPSRTSMSRQSRKRTGMILSPACERASTMWLSRLYARQTMFASSARSWRHTTHMFLSSSRWRSGRLSRISRASLP